MIEDFLINSAGIYALTETVSQDDYSITKTYALRATVACSKVFVKMVQEIQQGATQLKKQAIIYVEASTTISEKDRVIVNSTTFNVAGVKLADNEIQFKKIWMDFDG